MSKNNDKILKASIKHYEQLHFYKSKLELLPKKQLFSTDKSFLLKGFVDIIKRNNFNYWVFGSAQLSNNLKAQYHRVIPIKFEEYDYYQINQIKYTIHTLICLGANVYLAFTENKNYLEDNFGVDNSLLIKDLYALDSRLIYDVNEELHLIPRKPDNYSLFKNYLDKNWRESSQVFSLKHSRNYFTCGVRRGGESLRKKYGLFLYYLQNGKCAISNEKFNFSELEVDHIVPAAKGGNNSIINLQLVHKKINNKKSDTLDVLADRIFNDEELFKMGLDNTFPYAELTKRITNINPFRYYLI